MSSGTLEEIWGERALLAPAFACAIGVGYLPLLVLPWTFGALVSRAGYTASQAGWIATTEIGSLAIASLLAARWGSVSHRRLLAGGSMLLAVLANAITLIVPPAGVAFVVTRIISGAACGVAVAVGNAAAAGSNNPTRAFAVLWFLMALWQFAIFNATPWLVGRAGLEGAYGLIAVCCLCYFPLGLAMPDPAPAPLQRAGPREATLRGVQTVMVLGAFLTFWLRDALVYSMSQRLGIEAGVSAQSFGTLLGIASVAGLAGPALAARLGSGTPRAYLTSASLVLALGVSATMAITRSDWPFSIAVLLMPAAGLFAVSLLSGLAAHVDPTGRLAALGAGLGFLSEGIGPAVGGSLVEFGGRGVYAVVVIAVGAITLLAALAAEACTLHTGDTTAAANARPTPSGSD